MILLTLLSSAFGFGNKHRTGSKAIRCITTCKRGLRKYPKGQDGDSRDFGVTERNVRLLCKQGRLQEALDSLDPMDQPGIQVDSSTYASLLRGCMNLKSLQKGKQVHALIIETGFEHDIFLGNNLISMYAKCGSLMDAHQVFINMPKRDVVSWNAMIAGCTQYGHGNEALSLFWQMQESGVKPNKITFISVLNACVIPAALTEGIMVHAYIVNNGMESDVIVGSALANMYSKCGKIEDVWQVFEKMPKQNVVSWNVMIAGCTQKGYAKEALELFWQMQEEGVKSNKVTFVSVLNACTSSPALAHGKLVHAYIVDNRMESDVIVGSALVNMYCKCASIEDAYKVLNRLPVRDVVSWTTLIAGYAQHEHGEEALKLYWQMQKEGVKPNKVTFINILSACATVKALAEGKLFHAHIADCGLELDVFVGTAIVNMYSKCTSIKDALNVFNKLPNKDVVTWNALVVGCAEHGHGEDALKLYWQMQKSGIKPNHVTFLGILNACGSMAALAKGKLIHAQILDNRVDLDLVLGNALLDMYAKCGSIENARQAFNRIPERNVVSWTMMIAGYAQHGCGKQALEAFQEMQEEGMNPDQFTFSSVLSACASLAALLEGREVHAHIIGAGFESDVSVANALIDMYAKCGTLEDSRQVFDKMPERDVVSWNALIAGYAQHGYDKETLKLFNQMQHEGIKPDQFTFSIILTACANVAALVQGQQVHAQIRNSGFETDVFVGAALVDMYAKCGSIKEALEVFNNLHTRNVVSWTAIIAGCAQHGHCLKALELFEEMQREGINPDEFTLSSVLTACGRAGLIDEGSHFFYSMNHDYGITPTMMHYAGMVDLLGRAGHFSEAESIINKMPVQPNIEVWMSLLGACRNHGKMEIAKHVAEHIHELDPQNAAAFVLLANVYAAYIGGTSSKDVTSDGEHE